MKTRFARRAAYTAATSALLTAALAGGCGGKGSYTKDYTSAAEQKVSVLKAGTEWQMAHQAFLAGDLEKALRKVDASLRMNDTVPKSHILRGRILMEQGDLGASLQALYTAETLDPNNPDAQYYLGIIHERLLEPETAADRFMRASELDGHNPQYAVAAAEMLIDLGRVDEAKAYLSDGPMFEHDAGVQQALGHIAMIQGEPSVAVERFREATLLAPDDDAIAEDLVRAQVEVGRYADAERGLTRMLADPEHAQRRDLLHLHARCLVFLDEPVEARTIYQNLVSTDEGRNDAEAWSGLGNVAFMIGDERTLRRAASRLVVIAPGRPDGYQLWALIHRQAGEFRSALDSVDRALELFPNDSALHALRGLVLSDMNRPGQAAVAFTNAVSLDPTNQTYRMLLEMVEAGDTRATTAPSTTE